MSIVQVLKQNIYRITNSSLKISIINKYKNMIRLAEKPHVTSTSVA